jgi:hypothetical protein
MSLIQKVLYIVPPSLLVVAQGVAERIMLRELLRRVEMKVIQENRLDGVVRLHTSLPPGRIGLAAWVAGFPATQLLPYQNVSRKPSCSVRGA